MIRDFCYVNKEYRICTLQGDPRKNLFEDNCNLGLLLVGMESEEEREFLMNEYESEVVGEESMAVIMSPKHPLANRSSVRVEELKNENMIAPN